MRALPEEEDVARALLGSLSPAQAKRAVLELDVPADILWNPDREKDILGSPKGLPYADMNETQRSLLQRLVETYVRNLQHEIADAQLAGIRAAGLDQIHFAWIGATQKGSGHYYRIHGPTFAIEYDNTQNRANHVHAVYHDLTVDFGGDLLLKHYQDHHQKNRD
jgi:hypothetical protein